MMSIVQRRKSSFRRTGVGESGATAVEYAIMVSLIAAVIIVAVVLLGQGTNSNFDCTGDAMETRTSGC